MEEKITIREACRRRIQIGPAEAEALEHGLTQLETENKKLRAMYDSANYEVAKWRGELNGAEAALADALLHNTALLEVVRKCARWVGKVPLTSDEYLEERVALAAAMGVLANGGTEKRHCGSPPSCSHCYSKTCACPCAVCLAAKERC